MSYRDAAPFPMQLIRMLSRDREGQVTFNYAMLVGRQQFLLEHLNELLERAPKIPAKYCKQALVAAAEFSAHHHEISQEVDRQWSAYLEALNEARERRAAEIRALKAA